MDTLDAIVFKCLTNAAENNYYLSGSSIDIARDLEAKVDILAGIDIAHLINAVDTWRTTNQNLKSVNL